jgi:hypothetical protein
MAEERATKATRILGYMIKGYETRRKWYEEASLNKRVWDCRRIR